MLDLLAYLQLISMYPTVLWQVRDLQQVLFHWHDSYSMIRSGFSCFTNIGISLRYVLQHQVVSMTRSNPVEVLAITVSCVCSSWLNRNPRSSKRFRWLISIFSNGYTMTLFYELLSDSNCWWLVTCTIPSKNEIVQRRRTRHRVVFWGSYLKGK